MNGDAMEVLRAIEPALARFRQWELPLRRFRAENYRRLNKDGYTWEAYQRGLAELEASLTAVDDPRAELYSHFDRLCAAYAASSGNVRIQVREFVAVRKSMGRLLWRYAHHLRTLVQGPGDSRLVSLALAALSIENCSANYRDTLMTLADLYVAAEQAGIDPQPLFAAVAEWSTNEYTTGGCESLATMLCEFSDSSVLRERRGMDAPYGLPP
jgi:hypothetical protein